MGRYAASLRAFGRVFANRKVRNVQIAGAGSTLGTWAYAVALPVFAYNAAMRDEKLPRKALPAPAPARSN